MSVWDRLKIQQTDDVKKIKTAYAKALKTCRPDEDPKGFQTLHQAYKAALLQAQKATNEKTENGQPPQTEDQESAETHEDTTADKLEETPEQQAYIEFLNTEYDRHIEKVSEVLGNSKTRNETQEWSFLLHSDVILEPQVNAQLGLFVLDNILKINSEFDKLSRHKKKYSEPNAKVKSDTVRYLDDIFHWRGQVQSMRYYLGDENTIQILNMLEAHNHNADFESAIKSVKGGKVHQNKVRKVNHAALYSEAADALEHLKKLTYWTHGISIFLLTVVIPSLIREEKISTVMFVGATLTLLIGQMFGVAKRNRYILYTMWPIACLLILSFPWGTFVGWRMTQCLDKGLKYFRYS